MARHRRPREPTAIPPTASELTFTGEPLGTTCRYGEESMVFNDRRLRRTKADATGLHTFDEIPQRLFKIPQQREQRLSVTPQQRQAAAALYGCPVWRIGPCAGCSTPIHRYACPRRASRRPSCTDATGHLRIVEDELIARTLHDGNRNHA